MGLRTAYYKSTNGKSLKENLIIFYPDFKNWILTENKNSIEEFGERLISKEVDDFFKRHTGIKIIDYYDQKIIDELTFEFLLSYCDYGKGEELFDLIGPCMNQWRYDKSSILINKTNDYHLIKLWNYLIKGRSVKNELPFIKVEGQTIGFWKEEEKVWLKNRLNEFKDNLNVRDNDGREYERDIEGIEYVLSVLEYVNNNEFELIFNRE